MAGKMVSAAAEASDELMDKYLETGELDEADIIRGLRKRTISGEIQPMLCGSAFKNKGAANAGCHCRADAIAAGRPGH
jgi:elongation factor G